MRRDRSWAFLPIAVLLSTALALAPFQGAAAYAMEDDAAGGSPEGSGGTPRACLGLQIPLHFYSVLSLTNRFLWYIIY